MGETREVMSACKGWSHRSSSPRQQDPHKETTEKNGPPPLESEVERRTQVTRAEPTLAQAILALRLARSKGVTRMDYLSLLFARFLGGFILWG